MWDYAGVNAFRSGRDAELEMHPTVKPTALVIDAIKDCSRRGDIVLDAFSGSGTTIMAAHKSRRRARAIELDPLYVDVAIRRWQSYTGQMATMAVTGESFAESSSAARSFAVAIAEIEETQIAVVAGTTEPLNLIRWRNQGTTNSPRSESWIGSFWTLRDAKIQR